MNPAILRFSALEQMVGLSRTTVWRMERAGSFPSRLQLSDNAVGWLRSDIEEWIAQRKPVGQQQQGLPASIEEATTGRG